jgi:hypothetical protein
VVLEVLFLLQVPVALVALVVQLRLRPMYHLILKYRKVLGYLVVRVYLMFQKIPLVQSVLVCLKFLMNLMFRELN